MRDLPQNLEAERAVIGACLLVPAAYATASGIVRGEDFGNSLTRRAWDSIGKLTSDRAAIDVVTVAAAMRGEAGGPLAEAETMDWLVNSAAAAAQAENIAFYARLVREAADRRRLILLCREQAARAQDPEVPLQDALDQAAGGVLGIATGRPGELVPLSQAVGEALNGIEARSQQAQDGAVLGVRTGVWAIDSLIQGIRPGELCVIAGSPGGGKSALALQAALTTCLEDGGTALVMSMEMPRVMVGERVVSHLARIDSSTIRSGNLDLAQWNAALAAQRRVKDGIFVNDRRMDFASTVAEVRRWRTRNKPPRLGCFVVDYLQLVKIEVSRGMTEASALGEIAYGCSSLAKETDAAAILVAALNRTAAQEKEAPGIHNLKGSSGIEYAANQILMIHNPERVEDGEVDVIVGKNRSGPRRTARVQWTGKNYRFSDPPQSDPRQGDLGGVQ